MHPQLLRDDGVSYALSGPLPYDGELLRAPPLGLGHLGGHGGHGPTTTVQAPVRHRLCPSLT